MKFASGALKGSGFMPRLTSFSKTYGTAEKPCPFKTPTPGIFPQAVKRCATQGRIFPPEIGFSATPWEAVPFREIVASFARCPDGGVRGYVGIATSHAPQIIFLIVVMFSHRIQGKLASPAPLETDIERRSLECPCPLSGRAAANAGTSSGIDFTCARSSAAAGRSF
jgi:hypothetical protein